METEHILSFGGSMFVSFDAYAFVFFFHLCFCIVLYFNPLPFYLKLNIQIPYLVTQAFGRAVF